MIFNSPDPFENSTEKSFNAVKKPDTKSWLNSIVPYFLWIKQMPVKFDIR